MFFAYSKSLIFLRYGFVDFESEDNCKATKEAMEDCEIDGSKVKVAYAKQKGEPGHPVASKGSAGRPGGQPGGQPAGQPADGGKGGKGGKGKKGKKGGNRLLAYCRLIVVFLNSEHIDKDDSLISE